MVSAEEILEQAKKHHVDIIGLSGLITPSLDEMIHVAEEMQRQDFDVPLMIGGATTSKVHTAVKLMDKYTNNSIIHVLDASKSVSVSSKLLGSDSENFKSDMKEKYSEIKDHYLKRRSQKEYILLKDARKNCFYYDWNNYNPITPNNLGVNIFENINTHIEKIIYEKN